MEVTEGQKQELLGFLLENAKQATDLFKEEAPKVFQEIVAYAYLSYSIELALSILGGIFAGFALYMFTKWFKAQQERSTSDAEDLRAIILGSSGALVGLCSAIALFESCFGLAQVYFAPRVYVLQFLT